MKSFAKPHSFLRLGMQACDEEGSFTIMPYQRLLNESIEAHLTGEYSTTIRGLFFALRVDCDNYSWGPSGPYDFSLRPDGSVTAEVGIHVDEWKGGDHVAIRRLLVVKTNEAVRFTMNEIAHRRLPFAQEEFQVDWDKAMFDYIVKAKYKPTLKLGSNLGETLLPEQKE